jgi:DNA-binding MarR family transcriptional regulator
MIAERNDFMRKITPRDNPCYCIKSRRAANALTKHYDKTFEPVQLTASQFSLLNDIKLLKTCNKSELAIYAKLDRTTIIRNLNTLLEKGLIKEVLGSNNRNNLIQLTELGESTIREGIILWKQAQAQIEATIGLNCIEEFNQILKKIESLG